MRWTDDLLVLVALGWWAQTLVILAKRPAGRWPHRWWGKAASLLTAGLLFSVWSGLLVPYGAIVVRWRLRQRRDPFELPMADGRPMK